MLRSQDWSAKFGVQQKAGSPDMGPIVTLERLFRLFLENFSLGSAKFLSDFLYVNRGQ